LTFSEPKSTSSTEEVTNTTSPTEEATKTTSSTEEVTNTTSPTEEATNTTSSTEEVTNTTSPTEEATNTTSSTEKEANTTSSTKEVTDTTKKEPVRFALWIPEFPKINLEKRIAENNGETELTLADERLTDQDMEIVAHNALKENKVSDIVFYVIIRERNRVFVWLSLSENVCKIKWLICKDQKNGECHQ
jgi:hypothetical protein